MTYRHLSPAPPVIPQLPLCPRPLPGESLLSWVDHVGSEFGITRAGAAAELLLDQPSDTVQLIRDEFGLTFKQASTHLRLGSSRLGGRMIRLGNESLAMVQARTGLSVEELKAMTAETGYIGLLVSTWLSSPQHADYFGVPPFQHLHSAACPLCLKETGGRWQLCWRLAVMTFCPHHRCYLLSQCSCRRRLHDSSKSISGRRYCPKYYWLPGVVDCGRPLSTLPTIEMTDPRLDTISTLIEHHLTDSLTSELDWAMRLTLCAGTARLAEDADPGVRDAFAKFCLARDEQWDPHRADLGISGQSAFQIEPSEEPLVLAAAVRVAGTLVFTRDLPRWIRWFCERTDPRWDVLSRHLHHIGGVQRLRQGFQKYGGYVTGQIDHDSAPDRPDLPAGRCSLRPARQAWSVLVEGVPGTGSPRSPR